MMPELSKSERGSLLKKKGKTNSLIKENDEDCKICPLYKEFGYLYCPSNNNARICFLEASGRSRTIKCIQCKHWLRTKPIRPRRNSDVILRAMESQRNKGICVPLSKLKGKRVSTRNEETCILFDQIKLQNIKRQKS